MTNSWNDVKNTKLALIFSNPFENHVSVARFLNEAKANGAKLVTIEPRRTRTADASDVYARIRPGTDIAFINGLIKYIFDNTLEDRTYLFGKTDAGFKLNGTAGANYLDSTDYARDANSIALKTADAATMVSDASSVYNYLKNRVAGYDKNTVMAICGCTSGDFDAVTAEIAAIMNANVSIPREFDKKRITILYAMGTTQHSKGSQNVRSYAVIQLVLGMMGKAGGGVNALRGIHNVQGSTDMAVLRDLLPGYSGIPSVGQSYGAYQDGLFGAPKNSTYAGYGAITTNSPWKGWQQVGFANQLHHFFHQSVKPAGGAVDGGPEYDGVEYPTGSADTVKNSNYNFDLLPRTAGDDHRTMFEKMQLPDADANRTKALICWGQNPAVTEANLTRVRAGLKNLDLLVCVDVFENETASSDRKATGVTYLLPAAAFVERPGSVTNSARELLWRYQATLPKGKCKSDLEIMLSLAKKLDAAAAFSHIPLEGSYTDRYAQLYGDATGGGAEVAASGYGWTPAATLAETPLDAATTDTIYSNVYKQMCKWIQPGSSSGGTVWIYGAGYMPMNTTEGAVGPKVGTKLASSANAGATSVVVDAVPNSLTSAAVNVQPAKVVIGGFNSAETVTVSSVVGTTINLAAPLAKSHAAGEDFTPRGYYSWHAADGIIAKSRSPYDPFGNSVYPRFSFGWLVNRRVFYNYNKCATNDPGREKNNALTGNGSRWTPGYCTYCEDTCPYRPAGDGTCPVPMDARDLIVASDNRGRLFVHYSGDAGVPSPVPVDISGAASTAVFRYRAYNKLAEPGGQCPKHWEPWETPYDGNSVNPITGITRSNYKGTYGTVGDDPVGYAVPVGSSADYPLILTTFRFTEHFQGGPTTRNIDWLVELKPEPVIEMNFYDAVNWGTYVSGQPIKSGDRVYLMSARTAAEVGPFTAVVGSGIEITQPVGQGVVAIPWHWGRKVINQTADTRTYSEGASANDLCIDKLDKNTKMQETKACLVKIARVEHV